MKEAVFVTVLIVAWYAAWLAIDFVRPMDTAEARKSNPGAVTPENAPLLGPGIERTIEALGGSVEEGVEP
ncbi:MAG: hypothetical protein P4L67_05175 [Candidatus Pacebacteria bacterium]|nr:hypothetical protein [Candidatus Paceibacterota bacterium]